jgi:hypothetical protein
MWIIPLAVAETEQSSRNGSEKVESLIIDIGPISLFLRDKIFHSSDEMIYISGYSNITLISYNFRKIPAPLPSNIIKTDEETLKIHRNRRTNSQNPSNLSKSILAMRSMLSVLSATMLGISHEHSTRMLQQKPFSSFPIIIFFTLYALYRVSISLFAIFDDFIPGFAIVKPQFPHSSTGFDRKHEIGNSTSAKFRGKYLGIDEIKGCTSSNTVEFLDDDIESILNWTTHTLVVPQEWSSNVAIRAWVSNRLKK